MIDLRQRPRFCRAVQLLVEPERAHVVGALVDIDEVDVGTAIEGRVGACHERQRAGPDAVARTDAQGQAGKMERARRAVRRNAVFRAATGCDGFLEGGNDRALGQEVRPEDLDDGLDVGLADRLAPVGYQAGLTPDASDRHAGGSAARSSLDRQEIRIGAAVVGEPRLNAGPAALLEIVVRQMVGRAGQDRIIRARDRRC